MVGANGTGKTTLITALAGLRELDGGKLRRGHNVKLGLLSQHAEEMGSTGTVVEACQRATGLTPNNARALLGQFLFSGEEAEKPIDGLSGGERRRLSLAILVHSGANVLILDEPTNHLDLESREALEEALQQFQGALLLISHDRALLDAVGTRTVALEDQTLHSYMGGWPEYVRVREERAEAARTAKRTKPAAVAAAPAPRPRPPSRRGRRTSRRARRSSRRRSRPPRRRWRRWRSSSPIRRRGTTRARRRSRPRAMRRPRRSWRTCTRAGSLSRAEGLSWRCVVRGAGRPDGGTFRRSARKLALLARPEGPTAVRPGTWSADRRPDSRGLGGQARTTRCEGAPRCDVAIGCQRPRRRVVPPLRAPAQPRACSNDRCAFGALSR